MKKWKRQVSACLFGVMLLAAFQKTSMGADAVKTKNAGAQNYSPYGSTVKSYLVSNGDGTLCRVEYFNGSVIVEDYDENDALLEQRFLPRELPIFGGFYSGEEFYFLAFGQNNPAEDNGTEVLRVVKYTKDWERAGAVSLYGENTCKPFDGGSLRMAEYDGALYVRTCHQMYRTSDGLRHQASLAFSIDPSDMRIIAKYTGKSGGGYTSHSFNQFIAAGDALISADHGDAYPRAVVLRKYGNFSSAGNYNSVNVLPIGGLRGNNYTGVSVGGLVISGSSYLTAGNSVAQGDSYNAGGVRNIFVTSTSKSDFSSGGTTVRWITNYTDANSKVSNPHLVKISDNRILLLYTAYGKVNYVYLDGKGNMAGSIKTIENASLSDCVPAVLDDGSVIWYYTNNSAPIFCGIDALGNVRKKISFNYAPYEMETWETFGMEVTTSGFGPAPAITWTSSDESIASVDSAGNVTPAAAGNVTITAEIEGIKADCPIVIVEPDPNPEGILLNHSSYTLEVGQAVRLQVSGNEAGAKALLEQEAVQIHESVQMQESLQMPAAGSGVEPEAGARPEETAADEESGEETGETGRQTEETSENRAEQELGEEAVRPQIAESEPETEMNFQTGGADEEEVIQAHALGNGLRFETSFLEAREASSFQADAVTEWTSTDESVAKVDSDGKVTAVNVGSARIKATVGESTVSCRIFVKARSLGQAEPAGDDKPSGSKPAQKNDSKTAYSGSTGGGEAGSAPNKGGSSRPAYVVRGTWKQNADGSWSFAGSDGKPYKNRWGAIINPYADVAGGHAEFDWFFFDENGAMRTGWFVDEDGNVYYLNENSDGTKGRMMTGWCWIPDETGIQKCYYLNPVSDGTKGKLFVSTVIDGYAVNEKGEWSEHGAVQTQ